MAPMAAGDKLLLGATPGPNTTAAPRQLQIRSPSTASPAPKFQVISLSDENPQIRDYKRRKPHTKTKAGCLACKKKRVKCDQVAPICLRCQRNQRLCVYEHDDVPATSGPGPGTRRASTAAARAVASRARAASVLPRPNFRSLNIQAMPGSAPDVGTSSDFLLHHFHTHWISIMGMPPFTGSLMPMALKYPHVRSTLMAVAAAHLRHAVPESKDHRLAEHFQQSLAIRAYQDALATPLAVHGQAGTDSLLLTAMFMNILAFALPLDEDAVAGDPDPARSWVFSPRDDRLGWLAVQMGLSPLLVATRPWRAKSFLAPIFQNSDDERRTLSGSWQRLARVPSHWMALFGLDREAPRRAGPGGGGHAAAAGMSDNDRLFRGPLRVLSEIRELEPSPRNVLRYFQFVGHLSNEFRLLMHGRDEKTLWAFGMWLGLMCRFGNHVWWTARRTRRDFIAVRMWLHQAGVERRPGMEGRLWRELVKDLDATWGFQFDASVMR